MGVSSGVYFSEAKHAMVLLPTFFHVRFYGLYIKNKKRIKVSHNLIILVFSPASLLTQILGILVPELEDLSVVLNGLQGLLGYGPQLLLQIVFYLNGVLDLNPYTNPLQTANFLLGMLIVGRSVVMFDILHKDRKTNHRLTTPRSEKFAYCIQVVQFRLEAYQLKHFHGTTECFLKETASTTSANLTS